MKSSFSNWRRAGLSALVISIALPAAATGLQLISVRDTSFNPPSGGGGDSEAPIISADGRHVLFASTAKNLAPTTNTSPVSGLRPTTLNVFLRDRTNGTTTLVSVNLAGTSGGNGDSLPAGISTNGQYVLFESAASDLVSGDNNGSISNTLSGSDVFLRNLAGGTTELVSVSTNGASGDGPSRNPVMTPDGRFIAFVSAATDLVAGDTNGIPDVFVRDRQAATTVLVSVGAKATNDFLPVPIGSSELPDITADGRYVAFYSTATNLVPGVNTSGEIYVRDLLDETTVCASTSARTVFQLVMGTTNVVSFNPAISADGQYVAFETRTNASTPSLGSGMIFRYQRQTGLLDIVHANAHVPAAAYEDIRTLTITPDGRFIAFVANANDASGVNTAVFLWDAQDGISTLVSADLNGAVPSNAICALPAVDASGRYVAFVCNATNMVTNVLAGEFHLYLRDTQTGTTRLLDAGTNGVGIGVSPALAPALSADGNFVAFNCPDGNVVADDRNHGEDVFVRDLTTDTTELISVRHPGLPCQAPNAASGFSSISVSSNGLYIAFTSEADNLTANDTNGYRDVYVRDLLNGTNILVSVNTNGVAASGFSSEPAISGDGRYVAFTSMANDLVAGDTNNALDVFVRDLQTDTTVLVSVSTNGVSPGWGNYSYDSDSYSPTISTDGRYVLFLSKAQNLAPVSPPFISPVANLFLRDLQAVTNYALTTSGLSDASMTPDGRLVAFVGTIPSTFTSKLYVWDSLAAARIYTNSPSSAPVMVSISPDGQRLAYIYWVSTAPYNLDMADLVANTNCIVSTGPFQLFRPYSRIGLRFSGDGRFLVYSTGATNAITDTNATYDVYLYDFQTGTNFLVSRAFNSAGSPNGASDFPDISPDGRFIAYRSFASNCVPNDFNDVPDLFLYDRLSGVTTLVSPSQSGNWTANQRSRAPVFSTGNKTLFFSSCASDLLDEDFNHGSDVFALQFIPSPMTDADGDGMDDQWELDHFLTLARDGRGDYDGDGATDLNEYLAGTDPADPASLFRIEIVYSGTAGQNPVITWGAVPGRVYRVQFKNALADPVWQDLDGNVALVGTQGYFMDLAPAASQRFYRVVVVTDLDADAMNDQWELDHFNTLARDGAGDYDGDGDIDLKEYQTRTDPTDPLSLFRAEIVCSGAGECPEISWPAAQGKTYRVQFKDALGEPVWRELSGNVIFIGNRGYAYDLAPPAGQRLYRVVLDPRTRRL